MLAVLLLLIAAGLFFVWIDQALAAGLFLIAALLVAAFWLLKGTGKAARETAGAMTKGMAEEAAKAETQSPESSLLKEGVENAGQLAGQQAFAPDTHQFKLKGFGAIGEACERLAERFKKAFK